MRFHIQKALGESSKGQLWPCDVTKGHHSLLANNFWQKHDTGFKTASLRFSRQDGSKDMQHDLFGSGHDLDLRSNFIYEFSGLYYTSFDASWGAEYNGDKIIDVDIRNSMLWFGIDLSWPLEAKPLTWGQIWEHITEMPVKGLSNVFFPRPRSPYSSRVTASFVGKCRPQSDYGEIWPLVTSSDVIFDLSEKMTEVLSVDLLPSFRMPFAASRYVA